MGAEVTILLPHGEVKATESRLSKRVSGLAGKRVGFIDNVLWQSMHVLVDELDRVLTSEYGVEKTEVLSTHANWSHPDEFRAQLEGFGERVDAVISGMGN